MGIFKWVQEKASSVYQGAQTVISTTIDVIGAVVNVLTADSFLKSMSSSFVLAWRGFASVSLNPVPLLTAMIRPNSRQVLMTGTASALLRLAPVLLYNAGVRPLVGTALKTAGCDYPLVEQATVGVLDIAATLYFTRNAVRGLADTAACNMAMVKVSADDSYVKADPALPANPMMQGCEHPVESHIMAGVASSYQYLTNSVLLYMLSCSLPYGEYVTLPLFVLFNGRNLLDVSLANNCSDHRLEVLNKNNAYAVGLGYSYWTTFKFLQYTTKYFTNSEGYFVNEALNAALYLYYVMATQYNRETPLPGKTEGTDYFYYNRMLADAVVQNTWKWIGERKTKDKYLYATLKAKINHFASHPAVVKVSDLLVDPALQSWHTAMKRDTAKLYLKHCGPDILNGLEFVMDMRADPFYKRVNRFKNVFPTVMEEDRSKLSLIMNEELQEPIAEWYRFFSNMVDPQRAKQYAQRLAQEEQQRQDNIFEHQDLRRLSEKPQLPRLDN